MRNPFKNPSGGIPDLVKDSTKVNPWCVIEIEKRREYEVHHISNLTDDMVIVHFQPTRERAEARIKEIVAFWKRVGL